LSFLAVLLRPLEFLAVLLRPLEFLAVLLRPFAILAILLRPFEFLAILLRPLEVFFAPKDFLTIWISNILALRVPGEGYSRNVSCVLN
jgi:hypothetical protein